MKGLELVVTAIAAQCDGARKKDGRGFSRADAFEGARLAALARAGMPWSVSDAKRALEMAGRHPGQAAKLLGEGDPAREKRIEGALRAGKVVPAATVPDEAQKPYNLAALSSGARSVNLWRMAWIPGLAAFTAGLREIGKLKHGRRRIRVVRNPKAEMTVNGKRKRVERWEVPFNGTALPRVLELARAHGFAVDPAVEAGPDPVVDSLRRSSNACWFADGGPSGRDPVVVFDLDRKDEAFVSTMKAVFRGAFSCSPEDDWNWTVPWTPRTRPGILALIDEFRFDADPDIQ